MDGSESIRDQLRPVRSRLGRNKVRCKRWYTLTRNEPTPHLLYLVRTAMNGMQTTLAPGDLTAGIGTENSLLIEVNFNFKSRLHFIADSLTDTFGTIIY